MNKKDTVVLIGNHMLTIYNFRKEFIERLVECNYNVVVFMPDSPEVDKVRELGCTVIDAPVDRRGMNPVKDLKLFMKYRKLLKQISPKAVFTYTVKPNIYGGLACRTLKIPYICTITGLGISIENGGLISKLVLGLYKVAMKKASKVYFQNDVNCKFFIDKKIVKDNYQVVKGSGVNLDAFSCRPFPKEDEPIRFVYIARICRTKGIDTLLEAAEYIKKKYDQTEFHILGFLEEDYAEKIKKCSDEGVVIYHGMQQDVIPFVEKCQCLLHPSFAEGMSNVCLEAAALGRAVITTDVPGCRECVDAGRTGLLHAVADGRDLIEKIEKFIAMPYNDRKKMGEEGRRKVEAEFSRRDIVDAYMREI